MGGPRPRTAPLGHVSVIFGSDFAIASSRPPEPLLRHSWALPDRHPGQAGWPDAEWPYVAARSVAAAVIPGSLAAWLSDQLGATLRRGSGTPARRSPEQPRVLAIEPSAHTSERLRAGVPS